MKRIHHFLQYLVVFSFLLSLVACSLPARILPVLQGFTKGEMPQAEVLFKVNLQKPLPTDTKLMLEVLDDVTGLYFNATRFELTKDDDLYYSAMILLSVNTEVKYRYVRMNDFTDYEFTSRQEQVRFRVLRVNGPEIILDHISGWINEPYTGPAGRITGQVIDQSNNAPIPNLLVAAGGMQTFTSTDGTFVISGLMPGVHNLVLYSMDGAYDTFQQGALVADGANTPVSVFLTRRPTTEVVFSVEVPKDFTNTEPLRLVSNSLSLGNAYADLSAGSSGSAANYPVLNKSTRNRYSIKLQLPVGYHFRYKYSQGDGLWNSELSDTGKFVIRDRIITENMVIRDSIQAFTVEDIAPVTIYLQATSTTPPQESVYIQFNPFGWTEPIPMVKAGDGKWVFTLKNPLHLLGGVEYRFCLNGDCDLSTDTSGERRIAAPSTEPQVLLSSVAEWRGNKVSSLDTSSLLPLGSIQPRPDFIAGVELTSEYLPGWQAVVEPGLAYSASLGSNWVILSPTWTASQGTTPALENKPGTDLLWSEILAYDKAVTHSGQKTIIYPLVNYAQSQDIFWKEGDHSTDWWLTWFDGYERFVLNNADIAQMLDLEAFIIGDPSLSPSMYNASSSDGDATRIPEEFSNRWSELINKVRLHYSGKLLGVAVVNSQTTWAPEWLNQVDMLFVLLIPEIETPDANISDIKREIDDLLVNQVQPIADQFSKPVMIGLAYPSGDVSALNDAFSSPDYVVSPAEAVDYPTDFETQAKVYSAAIVSAASNNWISGFISRGYYPYLDLQDASSTVYRKPVADIIWFWYHYLLNKTP